MLCQKIRNEGKTTVNLCYLLQEQVATKSEEREELMKLANIAEARLPTFTAAGYFEINKSVLMNIFGTVATYIIVLIQFNMSIY